MRRTPGNLSAFDRVLTAAKSVVRKVKAISIDYDAGDFVLEEITARKGATPFRIDTGEQFNMLIRSVDFIVAVDQLTNPDTGERFEPQAGHQIKLTRSGIVRTYEVLPQGDEDAYRFTDSTETEWRIHTKQIGEEVEA